MKTRFSFNFRTEKTTLLLTDMIQWTADALPSRGDILPVQTCQELVGWGSGLLTAERLTAGTFFRDMKWADAFETDFLKFKAEGHSDKDSVCKALAGLLKDGFYVDRIVWMTEDTETVPYIYLTKIVSGADEESGGIL